MSSTELESKPAQSAPTKNSLLSKHRILNAVLLRGLWKFKPIHVFALLVFLAYQGWLGSPYFMYYFVGAPEPGTAQRYVGTLRVEGELQRTKTGWIPPRYFIRTNQGEVEIHCGYKPYLRECWRFYDFHKHFSTMIYEIGYDRYWGIDYIRYPSDVSPKFQENGLPEIINTGRKASLIQHQTPAIIFFFIFLLYLYLIWQTYENSKPKRPPDADTLSLNPDAAKEPTELTKLKQTKSFFDQ